MQDDQRRLAISIKVRAADRDDCRRLDAIRRAAEDELELRAHQETARTILEVAKELGAAHRATPTR